MPKLDVATVAQEQFARIQRAALVMTGNPWDADDLAQETFLVLARQPGAFQGKSSVYTWLYSVLVNLDRRERRRLGVVRRKLHVLHANGESTSQSTPGADAPLESAEWKRSLWSVVAELPDGQRQTLVLRFSESLSYDEIAEVLECPLGTVKSRIFHGLLGLRKLLDERGEEARQLPAFPAEDVHHAV